MKFPGKEMKKRWLSILLVVALLVSGIYVGQQPQVQVQDMAANGHQTTTETGEIPETEVEELLQAAEEQFGEEFAKGQVSGFHQMENQPVENEPTVIGGQKLPVWQESTQESAVGETEETGGETVQEAEIPASQQVQEVSKEQLAQEVSQTEESQPVQEVQSIQEQPVLDKQPIVAEQVVVENQGTAGVGEERVINTGEERYAEVFAEELPQENEVVDFIVVLKEKALLDLFSQQEIVENTEAVEAHRQNQEAQLAALEAQLKESFGEEEDFQNGFWYTMASTGLSVKTYYKNKEAIEAMAGVERVYEAPLFELSAKDAGISTANASKMVGANALNSSGFTGKGMKIAIIDTGIVVDHPSFGALKENQLTESSFEESEIEALWSTLEAGKTNLRLAAYQNSKIPFAFNYTSMNFDVSHDLAQHDHGTHVAGIAAANKMDDTTVIGIAPEAQLLVMQVFDSSGGASWTTIMAALEDALRLDADVVNLSLGSPAGFTNSDAEMQAVLQKYESSDTQVIIAGGNDTHNGTMNRTGVNLSKKENPDHGLVGTPATFPTALAVASADNEAAEMLYFTVGSDKIGFQDTGGSDSVNFFKNYGGKTESFIFVGGYGEEKDYIGKDVEGKIAVVNRGVTSFQDKQTTAQSKGAIAVIVCNNVPGAFSMMIHDEEGHIPCIGISKADGEKLKTAKEGSLKVCEGDKITVALGKAMSTFSSWGPTPDLKIKPEITGVGGGIYATRDPQYGGSNYGDMSGTSMASPQVAGGMAVLIQYLRQHYPEKTGVELRKMAANLMLSTASQMIEKDNVPYSVRNQGAGLINLEKAVAAGAYFSNPKAHETRPLGEMGDSATGNFTFDFQITNFGKETLTYEFDSIVMTAELKDDAYMSDSTYKLNTKVVVKQGETSKNTIEVAPGETVDLKATIDITDSDDVAYLKKYPSGIYVEGYLYAKNTNEKKTLSMPLLGFYGDWSAPDVFDEDGDAASLYAPILHTQRSQLGINPYINNGAKGDQYNAVSSANPLVEMALGMLRNAKKVEFKVTSEDGTQTYFTAEEEKIVKTYYSASYGMIIPYYVMNYIDKPLVWDATNGGSELPDGTKAHYTISAYLDDGDDVADDTYEFDVTIDNAAPEIKEADTLSTKVQKDKIEGTVKLPVTLEDNHYIAGVIFESPEGVILGRYEVENQIPGQETEMTFDVTGYGSVFTMVVADYALNEVETEIEIDLSDMPILTEPKELPSDRIYGNETYNVGHVSQGWFSGKKDDFTDLRNETYDTFGTSYSGEYLEGYVISQRASDGALLLYTPYNTYWSARTLLTQEGAVGDAGFKVLYDMAMDYTTDTLYAIGWEYGGDNNGDGKDDGDNKLFKILLNRENVSIETLNPINGLGEIEGLTLGCDDKGQLYTISGDGKLYKLDKANGNTTLVGTTDFTKDPMYAGINVIQSMGFDHNTKEMYWFAHSQKANGGSYLNVSKVYKVDLTNAKCTEVGTAGQSGYTSLFIPNDKDTTLFEMNVDATGFEVSEEKLIMATGQKRRPSVTWKPWNAKELTVSWRSEDEKIAKVSASGQVTAVDVGETTVIASAELPGGKKEEIRISVEVVGGAGNLFGFVITDYRNAANETSWITYNDSNPKKVKNLKKDSKMWQGGAYYQGNLYVAVAKQEPYEPTDTELYRIKVNHDKENPENTTFESPQLINKTEGIEVGNLAFDYSTARMYGVDYTNGGLCIIDIETGGIDLMGTFGGDLGPAIMPAMCVTDTGRIIGSDMFGGIYEVNPDTMEATKLASIPVNTFYYAAMTFDHNTKNIYWNPCMGEGGSDLYMIRLGEEGQETTIINLGGVSSDGGVEQTVMFTIPDPEPETNYVEIEDIKITNANEKGELVGLVNGTLQLTTETTPKRPSISSKTWTSSNPDVASIDSFGKITYKTPGETEVTVSVKGKAEGNEGPFTHTIKVKVYESAEEMVAFLGSDEGATSYFDYWLNVKDYDLSHTELSQRSIDVYSLRTGEYYDGYIYAYNDKGELCRINAKNYADNVVIANHDLGEDDQIVSMAFNYKKGVMYALTLPPYNGTGNLASIDLTTGKVTIIAKTSKKVNALAVDKDGTMYAVGSPDYFDTAVLYTIDPETAECTKVMDIEGSVAYTGANYYGEIMYNPQMTYDYGTNRLYFYSSTRNKSLNSYARGLFLIQLKEGEGNTQTVDWYQGLGKLSLDMGGVPKVGNMYLGLLCSIPKVEQLPEAIVTAVRLSRTTSRIMVGDESQLTAQIVPGNAKERGILWESSDESIVTVSENGRIRGITEGTAEVYAISEGNLAIKSICEVIVSPKPESDDTTVGYTVSADQEALIAFNPEFPASTVRKVATLSGGKNVCGMALKDSETLYYLTYNVSESTWPILHRYNLRTNQSTRIGGLHVFIGDPSDMAYDPVNKLIYVASGFYIFQFEESKLLTGDVTDYSGTLDLTKTMASIAGTHSVTCKDGEIYVLVSNNQGKLYKVDDRFKNMSFVRNIDINTTPGESQMDYDSRTGYFYISDASERLWRFKEEAETPEELLDVFGYGWDMNGIALDVQLGEVPGEIVPEPDWTEEPENPDNTDPDNTDPDNTDPDNTNPDNTDPDNTNPDNTDTENPDNTDQGNTDQPQNPGQSTQPDQPQNPGQSTQSGGQNQTVTPNQPGNVPQTPGNSQGTLSEEEIKEALKPGKTFTSPDGIYQFRIKNNKEAAFIGVRISIPTVKIANTVTYLGKKFKVTSVEKNALKGDKKLKTLYVGANVITIGTSAFEGCKKLTKVSLGKKTKKIQAKVLKGCKALKKVTIPTNVTTIGKSVFEGCKKLGQITIKSKKLTKIQKNAFKGIQKNAKVKVPKKQLAKYKKILKNKGLSNKVTIR